MTADTPLTCYICGETGGMTIDMIGCFDPENREEANNRFEEKHGYRPDGYLHVCPQCRDGNPAYAQNVYQKYGRVKSKTEEMHG